MNNHTAKLVQTSTLGEGKGQVQITGLRPINHEGVPRAKICVDMLPIAVTEATLVVIRVTNEKNGEVYNLPFSFTHKDSVPGKPVNSSVTLAFASHPDHHRLLADLGMAEIRLVVEIQ